MSNKIRKLTLLILIFTTISGITTANASESLKKAQIAIDEHHYSDAELILNKRVLNAPKDAESRFLLARVLSWQGKQDDASKQYQNLLKKKPNNSDYMLGLAQTLYWSGQLRESLSLIEKAKRITSKNPDIWRLEIQVMASINDGKNLPQAIKLQAEAKHRFPHLTWDVTRLANSGKPQLSQVRSEVTVANNEVVEEPSYLKLRLTLRLLNPNRRQTNAAVEKIETVDAPASTQKQIADVLDRSLSKTYSNYFGAGLTHNDLTNGRGTWDSRYLEFEHKFAPRNVIYTNIQDVTRFERHDTQVLLGAYFPLPKSLTLNLEATYSPTAHTLPEGSLMGSLQFPLTSGWFLTGGGRRTEYTNGSSTSEFGVLEWYFGNYRAAYTLTDTQAQAENLIGQGISISRYYNETSFITLALGKGREVELDQSQKTLFDTSGISINGRHWFNPDWALLWALGSAHQGDAFNRTELNLGLRRAF